MPRRRLPLILPLRCYNCAEEVSRVAWLVSQATEDANPPVDRALVFCNRGCIERADKYASRQRVLLVA